MYILFYPPPPPPPHLPVLELDDAVSELPVRLTGDQVIEYTGQLAHRYCPTIYAYIYRSIIRVFILEGPQYCNCEYSTSLNGFPPISYCNPKLVSLIRVIVTIIIILYT